MPLHRFNLSDVHAKKQEQELRAQIDGAPPTREQLDAADRALFKLGAFVVFLWALALVVLYAAVKAWVTQ